jgi:acyl dehydratase
MTSKLVADGLEPGTEVPPFERTTGFHNWNRYAAVNDEFVDIHMDDGAGQAAGYPGAFGMGNLQWAYLHNMLREWIAPDGRIVTMACQFRGPNLRNSVVTARGTVTAVRPAGGETMVDVDVWTEAAGSGKVAVGTATVAIPGGAG